MQYMDGPRGLYSAEMVRNGGIMKEFNVTCNLNRKTLSFNSSAPFNSLLNVICSVSSAGPLKRVYVANSVDPDQTAPLGAV